MQKNILYDTFKMFGAVIKKEFKTVTVIILLLVILSFGIILFQNTVDIKSFPKYIPGFLIVLFLAIGILSNLLFFSISLDLVNGVFNFKKSFLKIFNYRLIVRYLVIALLLGLLLMIVGISGMALVLSMFASDGGPNKTADLMLYGGMISLFVSSIVTSIIGPRLLFSLFFTIEKNNISIIDSLRGGRGVTRGHFWAILGLFCIMFTFNPLLINLIWMSEHTRSLLESVLFFIQILLSAVLYKVLSHRKESENSALTSNN